MQTRNLTKEFHNGYGYHLAGSRLLETVRSPHQLIEVWESPALGRLFRLDGEFMTSERDEFFYHENLVHPAAVTHARPRRALVIGGGDGGSTEELLKHPDIERVTIVELDQKVVDIARRYLGGVHHGALDDPRVTLLIGDGVAFVGRATERFDLIVLDISGPDSPASAFYTEKFFAGARRLLNPGGALTMHIGPPLFRAEAFARHVRGLRAVFAVVRPMVVYVPLYGTLWGMALASDSLDPLAPGKPDLERRMEERKLSALRYYNADTHCAVFALPGFVRTLIT